MKYLELLNEYLNGYNLLENKINKLTSEILIYKPDIKDAWSIKEHIIHIADSEINNFIRWKSILAQPFSKCFVIEESAWTKKLDYEREDLKKYLLIFKLLRELTYEYLKNVDDEEWEKDYFIHEYKNQINKITLKRSMKIYTTHIYDHLKYIDRNINEYKKNVEKFFD